MNFQFTENLDETQWQSETGGGCVIFARIISDIKNGQYVIYFVQITIHTYYL